MPPFISDVGFTERPRASRIIRYRDQHLAVIKVIPRVPLEDINLDL